MKTPFPFQRQAIDWLKSRDVSLLCLEQGLGKTFVTVNALKTPATVACPAFLQYNWLDEIQEQGLTGTLVREQADLFKKVDVFIMSYHFLTNLDLEVVKAEHFVVDEFHSAKSLTAKRTQAVLAEIECVPNITLLSGTPMPSRPVELYPILDAIGAYDRGYYSYVHRYCAARRTQYGLDVNGSSREDELREIIAPWMLRFTKRQVMKDLPDKIYRVISLDIELPPEEKEYDLRHFQNVRPDIAFETMSTVMRLHAAYKFKGVCEVIDHYVGYDEKLIVFGHHREEMLLPLYERYSEMGYEPAFIAGGVSPLKKREEEKRFQEDESCRIIILGIKAGGVGLTLTAASRVVMAESSWVPSDIDQAADRAHRIGQTLGVNVDLITIRNSIDEYQLRRALEKLRVINRVIQESDLTMKTKALDKLTTIREELDELEELLSTNADEEEEEKPKRRRRSKKADEEEEEKPKRRRRSKKADEEEEEKPKRRRRSKKADEDEEEEEKPKRRRRSKKAEKEESPFDIVRAKASELMKATDRATLEEILEEFEVDKISALEEDDYEDFVAACDETLEDS